MRAYVLLAAGLVLAVVSPRSSTGRAPRDRQGPDGQTLYREQCRTCHGVTGTPPRRAVTQYGTIPTLSDSAFLAARSDDSLVAVLANGVGKDMKSFKDKLTPEEMRAVVAYVRTLPQGRRPN